MGAGAIGIWALQLCPLFSSLRFWARRPVKVNLLSTHKIRSPSLWWAEGGSPRFVPISPFPSDLFRSALLVFGNAPIFSDLLCFFRSAPICFQNTSEQIRETPFCRRRKIQILSPSCISRDEQISFGLDQPNLTSSWVCFKASRKATLFWALKIDWISYSGTKGYQEKVSVSAFWLGVFLLYNKQEFS